MSPVATSSCGITRVSSMRMVIGKRSSTTEACMRTPGPTLAKSINRSVWNGGVAIAPTFGPIVPVVPNWHRSGAPVPSPPRQIHWHNRRHAALCQVCLFLTPSRRNPHTGSSPMISRALVAQGCSWRCFGLSCAKACHGTRQVLENGQGGPARIDGALRLRRKRTNAHY
jgi:hypothetical protein